MMTSRITREMLEEALMCACGNVTHAAEILEISKMHMMRLTLKFDLRERAKELREAVGRTTGRPRTREEDEEEEATSAPSIEELRQAAAI